VPAERPSSSARIALVLPFALSPDDSVGVKVRRTVRVWNDLGAVGRVFVMGDPGSWDPATVSVSPLRRGELWRQISVRRLTATVRDWGADVVYTRFSHYAPYFHEQLRFVPTCMEVNTDVVRELPLWSRRAAMHHRIFGDRADSNVDGYVFLTAELKRRDRRAGSRPACVIANGVDLDSLPSAPAPANTRPRVLFVAGTASPWQGEDKVYRLAQLRPDLDIDLVGPRGVASQPPSNLRLWGLLTTSALREVAAEADIALGTLALHRKGMDEACPLKLREYLALGVPSVVAHSDPDIDHLDVPWLLRVPNRADNVESFADAIGTFAHEMRGVRVPREQVAHLDLHQKEPVRLDFLEHLGRTSRDGGA